MANNNYVWDSSRSARNQYKTMINKELNSYITNRITHAIEEKQMLKNIKDST